MSTKMKGLLKGLKYISTIFEEEKEEEFQIGNPTDVKHVAHIGGDGPAVETPSWMKEFIPSSATGFSAPLGPPSDSKENPEIKWVSEDSKRGHNNKGAQNDLPGVPKSSRRNSDNNPNDSPRKQKTRQSRRQQAAKDSSDKSSQESTSSIPNIPRKSRQKKSKESNGGEAKSTRSRPKATFNDSDNDNSENGNRVTFKD